MKALLPTEPIEDRILILRGHKVLVDATLARLYGVSTKRLNQQVNRNRHRFPDDFVFTLTPTEKAEVVAKCNHLRALKFSQTMPRAFTEHGAIMAASVLNTPIAVQASIVVVRAFVRLRVALATHQELAGKLGELEKKIGTHDQQIRGLFDAIRRLMSPPVQPRRRIGYRGEP